MENQGQVFIQLFKQLEVLVMSNQTIGGFKL